MNCLRLGLILVAIGLTAPMMVSADSGGPGLTFESNAASLLYAHPSIALGPGEVILAPSQDTFITGDWRFQDEKFGGGEFLAVGTHPDLGEMISLLGYTWTLPVGYLGIERATLLFAAGDGGNSDLPVEILSAPVFYEWAVSWRNFRSQLQTGPDRGVIGKIGYWYEIDVTETAKRFSGDTYLGFGIRPVQAGFNHYKLTWSRDNDVTLAPHLRIRYRYDRTPPRVWFGEIPSWARINDDFFEIDGVDEPSPGIAFQMQLQWRGADGVWQDYGPLSSKLFLFPQGSLGQTIQLRLRGVDAIGNTSAWVYSHSIKVYSYDLRGFVTDHRENKIAGIQPNIRPEPWYTQLTPTDKSFIARLGQYRALSVNPKREGYGSWGRVSMPVTASNARLVLPPSDNLLAAFQDESAVWEGVQPQDTVRYMKNTGYAGGSLLLSPADGRLPARFCLRGIFSLDALNRPTLGLHFQYQKYYSNGKIDLVWQTEDGRAFHLGSASYQLPPLATPPPGYWEYGWADLTDVRLLDGHPCVEMTRSYTSSQTTTIYIDGISLGSSRSNLSITLIPPTYLSDSGASVNLDFIIANRDTVPATGRLTLTTDDGAAPHLSVLPVLAPGETITRTIVLPMPASGALIRAEAIVGKPTMDDTPEDNSASYTLIGGATAIFHPMVIR